MFTMDSLAFLAIAVAILFAAVQRGGDGARTMSEKTHRAICGAAIAAGVPRSAGGLTSLPAGISGGGACRRAGQSALADGRLPLPGRADDPAFAMGGRATGPLLAVLTAPFVGLFGIDKLTVRLPLALLSCAAMPARLRAGRGAFRQARGALDAADCRALPDFR
ncbi:MAG: hypothetical protein ACLUI3_12605 [Christensenellales bacterium]